MSKSTDFNTTNMNTSFVFFYTAAHATARAGLLGIPNLIHCLESKQHTVLSFVFPCRVAQAQQSQADHENVLFYPEDRDDNDELPQDAVRRHTFELNRRSTDLLASKA
jgi:hypothetical protein